MIVIADDITGAAEIAGIAFERGANVRLVCGGSIGCDIAAQDTTVIATDTRSMSEDEAISETRRILCIAECGDANSSAIGHQHSAIFKKTDSALRGHVIAELSSLMEVTGYQRAVYLPANPSKERIIRDGVYYINQVPIHETAFSYDPEFPAKTSVLKERFPEAEGKGIIIPNAENESDMRRVVAQYNDGKTLFAGAADLFQEVIGMGGAKEVIGERCGRLKNSIDKHPTPITQNTLILCGSTQSRALDLGIPVCPMPLEIYDGDEDLHLWDTNEYAKKHSLILTMPYTHRTGKDAAVHLRTMMAHKAKELVAAHCPEHLIIEGGATAWATLQVLGWTEFTITAQIAPGVVQMRATNGTLVTLKPGSYPWGGLF